jgi:uncharacterized membrane protein YedE/YeeE
MEPTTPPPNPAASEPLVEYVRTQRQNAAYGLLALAALLLALTVFLGLKAFRTPAAAEKPADRPLKDDPLDPERLEPTKPAEDTGNVQRMQYMFGWVGTLLGAGVLGICGGWLLAGVPPTGEEKQRAETRILLLVVGGLLGALLIIFGMIYFYLWSDSLGKWIDKRELKEARWVLIPLLIILAGAGLVFAAIQPARAEERNNSFIRRMVYGSNFALTALLLVVMLVVVNVLIAREVPNKLDTTATGFYSLSDNTRGLLARLAQPLTAYAVIPESEDRRVNDIRQLLTAYQENSDGKFKVRFLSQVAAADKTELAGLRSKYPQFNRSLEDRTSAGAVLLAAGENEQRHVVLGLSDFFNETGDFAGEGRLFKEVAFLADSQAKTVVYFTQGHGELDISGGGLVGQGLRSAMRLKEFLESYYLDVRPLPLSDDKPEIPGDADVIIVAEPRASFSDAAVNALRKYMTDPAKKGKLIFLSGAIPDPKGKMVRTGLEPLLNELNVRLGTQFVFNVPDQSMPTFNATIVVFHEEAIQNPILQSIIRLRDSFEFYQTRTVEPTKTSAAFQATPLLQTFGRTWLEDERPADLSTTFDELRQSPEAQRQKQLSRAGRPVAVIVSESGPGGAARAAVFGNSVFVTDEFARQMKRNPISFDLIGVTVDWLRGKESSAVVAGIEAKKYTEYSFPAPATVDFTRLVWLPLGLALLAVVGLGAGVWVIRRR